jgi:hypothetical protein
MQSYETVQRRISWRTLRIWRCVQAEERVQRVIAVSSIWPTVCTVIENAHLPVVWIFVDDLPGNGFTNHEVGQSTDCSDLTAPCFGYEWGIRNTGAEWRNHNKSTRDIFHYRDSLGKSDQQPMTKALGIEKINHLFPMDWMYWKPAQLSNTVLLTGAYRI